MSDRNIHNLQGLLRFALEYTRNEDAPNPSAFEEMDPERRQFLENVFKSMTVDVIEEFRKAIDILESDESNTKSKIEALDLIRDYVDHIDLANNFIKLGGSNIIISCLHSNVAEIRESSANLIAELTQNNPFCQKHFTEKNVLPRLIELLKDEEKVACQSLYAISCLVRHYEQALAEFIKIGGISHIMDCLREDQLKVFIKACFLLDALASEFAIVRAEFVKNDAFKKLVEYVEIKDEYDCKLETILRTLNTLLRLEGNTLSSSLPIVTQELCDKLHQIILKCEGKPSCQEIVEHAKTLLEQQQQQQKQQQSPQNRQENEVKYLTL